MWLKLAGTYVVPTTYDISNKETFLVLLKWMLEEMFLWFHVRIFFLSKQTELTELLRRQTGCFESSCSVFSDLGSNPGQGKIIMFSIFKSSLTHYCIIRRDRIKHVLLVVNTSKSDVIKTTPWNALLYTKTENVINNTISL